jgi:putative heme iron utilization protein
MSKEPVSPIRTTDEEARQTARQLPAEARHAALGVIDPETQGPMVTRIAIGLAEDGTPITFVSDLSAHSRALRANPKASLLIGEPGAKGDPLTHPRLTLLADAEEVPHKGAEHEALAQLWLRDHPKAKLYIGFGDFCFFRFHLSAIHLNGGFGKAYRLGPADLGRTA